MAGHNKWSKVKHQKAVTDARKAKVFGRMAKVIAAESQKANGDRHAPGLKAAIEKAKKENMPKDNIERAIQKGVSGDATDMQPVRFETYGPGGTAIVIQGVTDNNNRTASEIKHLLSKHSCELAELGAATWAFSTEGDRWAPITTITISSEDHQKLTELTDELEQHEDVEAVYTNAA